MSISVDRSWLNLLWKVKATWSSVNMTSGIWGASLGRSINQVRKWLVKAGFAGRFWDDYGIAKEVKRSTNWRSLRLFAIWRSPALLWWRYDIGGSRNCTPQPRTETISTSSRPKAPRRRVCSSTVVYLPLHSQKAGEKSRSHTWGSKTWVKDSRSNTREGTTYCREANEEHLINLGFFTHDIKCFSTWAGW